MIDNSDDTPHTCSDRDTDDVDHPDGSIPVADPILHGSLEQEDPESTCKRKSKSSIIDKSERGIEQDAPSNEKKYRDARCPLSSLHRHIGDESHGYGSYDWHIPSDQ
jgi:hypothetical protein